MSFSSRAALRLLRSSQAPYRSPALSQSHRTLITKTKQSSALASYYRGGTSRAVIFQEKDLPDRSQWPKIFLQIMGSPDPNGRQLDGFGAGISSLSKICIVDPSEHPDADVDYTFVGVGIETDEVDTAGNCGNMSAAIGPYAFNHRLLGDQNYDVDGEVIVRIHNTNTGVIIRSTFAVADGEALPPGSFSIDGVSGTHARIKLDFLHPAGSKTGKLLPTGQVIQKLSGIEASCVDAANPCVFVRAADLGVNGTILPDEFNSLPEKLCWLEDIRQEGALAMGMIKKKEDIPRTVPKVVVVSSPCDQIVLSGEQIKASKLDLVARCISDTQPHRAIPITAALCTAAAAMVPGSIVHQALIRDSFVDEGVITIGHPSGSIGVTAAMDGNGVLESASVFRTARRVMEGRVFWSE